MDDLISRKALIEGRVENDPVVIAANCAPTVFEKEKVIEKIKDYRGFAPSWVLRELVKIVEKGGIK